jgi:hypothetical protein
MFYLRRFQQWLEWRRLIGKQPVLAGCWKAVENCSVYQPGYLTFQATIIEPHDLYQISAYTMPWFPEAMKALSIGVISLEYLAPLKERFTKTYYVAIPGSKVLGASWSWHYHL